MGILFSQPDQELDDFSALKNENKVTHSSRPSRKRHKTRNGLEETSSKRRKKVSTANATHSNDPPAVNDTAPIAMEVSASNLNPKTKTKEGIDEFIKAKSKPTKVRVPSFESPNSRVDGLVTAGGVPPAGNNLSPCPSYTCPKSTKDSIITPIKPRSKQKVPTSPYFTQASYAPNFKDKKMSPRSKISVVETEIDLPSLPHFRPTSSDEFGLIQEKLRHEPWKMLVAVIFLNKTNAKVALPLLGQLFERWPTPEAVSQGTHHQPIAFSNLSKFSRIICIFIPHWSL